MFCFSIVVIYYLHTKQNKNIDNKILGVFRNKLKKTARRGRENTTGRESSATIFFYLRIESSRRLDMYTNTHTHTHEDDVIRIRMNTKKKTEEIQQLLCTKCENEYQ